MIVGTTVDPEAYDRLALYPGTRMCRVFGYSSKGMPVWKPTTGGDRVQRVRALAPSAIIAAVYQDPGGRHAGLLGQADNAVTRGGIRVHGTQDENVVRCESHAQHYSSLNKNEGPGHVHRVRAPRFFVQT